MVDFLINYALCIFAVFFIGGLFWAFVKVVDEYKEKKERSQAYLIAILIAALFLYYIEDANEQRRNTMYEHIVNIDKNNQKVKDFIYDVGLEGGYLEDSVKKIERDIEELYSFYEEIPYEE
jgi:hypothetical protein